MSWQAKNFNRNSTNDLATGLLGVGTYQVDMLINNQVVGTGMFALR
jgi:hypothetical protein